MRTYCTRAMPRRSSIAAASAWRCREAEDQQRRPNHASAHEAHIQPLSAISAQQVTVTSRIGVGVFLQIKMLELLARQAHSRWIFV